MRFLFGLCNNETMEELLIFVDLEGLNADPERNEIKQILQQFAITCLQQARFDSDYYIDNDNDHLLFFSWVREMRDESFTELAAASLKSEIIINRKLFLPNDVPAFNYVLKARKTKLYLKLQRPYLNCSCSLYFFTELHKTFNQNHNLKVSYSLKTS